MTTPDNEQILAEIRALHRKVDQVIADHAAVKTTVESWSKKARAALFLLKKVL